MGETLRAPKRVAVVGNTGSGKTALARRISQCVDIPHVELDAIRHGPNWTETPDDIFRDRVSLALSGEAWVADGSYSLVRDIVWPRTQMIVWLDYPLRTAMWRLFLRTVRRCFTQEELWNGNRESFRVAFLSRESLFLWGLKSHPRRRRTYPALFGRPEYAHLEVVRLRSPRETEQWLDGLTAPKRRGTAGRARLNPEERSNG